MIQLTVPEPYRPGLQKLVDYDDATIEALLDILRGEQPAFRGDLLSHVVAQAEGEGLSPDDVRQIMEALTALYVVRAHFDEPAPDFAKDVSNAMYIEVPDDKKQHFRNRLEHLLTIDVLLVASKARDVLTDYAHNFHGARILTDLRPIFKDDTSDSPAAVAIMHTLKIGYHVGRDPNVDDFFVALSPSDLQMLRNVIERAEAKARGLQYMLDTARVPYVRAESHIVRGFEDTEPSTPRDAVDGR